jgi:ubiquinol-cytochrome c reductase cytochrome b subunit/menaquinol-cytochrome c reductase cytochrome b/c subunit
MNQAEKEEYLREYSHLKNKGKPFFPYIVSKDAMMAVIVMFVIMFLAAYFGAELGPKPDPTTSTYVPRPEWYFFFLFEILRVIKPPVWTPMAIIGVPTICMILMFLLPFYDRSPERLITRRPIALATGIFVILAMGYLTYEGAAAGSPNQVDLKPPSNLSAQERQTFNAGKIVVGQSGCLACHKIGENGNDGPGPNLTKVGNRTYPAAIASTLINPTPPMPSFKALKQNDPQKFNDLVGFLSLLK